MTIRWWRVEAAWSLAEQSRKRSYISLAARSDVLQVLLDVPQRVGAGLQLAHFIICQGDFDHAGHAAAVQHAGQAQVHLLIDSIHTLYEKKKENIKLQLMFQVCVKMCV